MKSVSLLRAFISLWFVCERSCLRNVYRCEKWILLFIVTASCTAECICSTLNPDKLFVVMFSSCSYSFQGHLCATPRPERACTWSFHGEWWKPLYITHKENCSTDWPHILNFKHNAFVIITYYFQREREGIECEIYFYNFVCAICNAGVPNCKTQSNVKTTNRSLYVTKFKCLGRE